MSKEGALRSVLRAVRAVQDGTRRDGTRRNHRIDASSEAIQEANVGTPEGIMKVRIRTRMHTADTIINFERDVPSLRQAKRVFRALQSALPDLDLEMVVTQAGPGGGVEVGHRIDRTVMDREGAPVGQDRSWPGPGSR